MNSKPLAIMLIVQGLVVLTYSAITFSTPGKPVTFLGLKFENSRRHFTPPIAGALTVAGGLFLLAANYRHRD